MEFNKPWINEELKNEIFKKHKYHQRARKTKKPDAWDSFREQRNKVTAMLREAKLTHEGKDPEAMSKKEKKFFCDTCDRGYEERDQLDEHFGQHEKCGRDGCTFEAHAKIVELHIKMQHDLGYAPKIMKLNSPEAIEQWRGERKKNYPKAGNVAKREKEHAERLARGEVLNKKNFLHKNGARGRGRSGRSWGPSRGGMPGRFPMGFPMGMPFRPPFPFGPPPPPLRGMIGKRVGRGGRGHFGVRRHSTQGGSALKKFAGSASNGTAPSEVPATTPVIKEEPGDAAIAAPLVSEKKSPAVSATMEIAVVIKQEPVDVATDPLSVLGGDGGNST